MRIDSWLKIEPEDELNRDLLQTKLVVPNPEYLSRQKLGYSLNGVRRMDVLYKEVGNEIWVPRALADEFLEKGYTIKDETEYGHDIDFKPRITLGPNEHRQENQTLFVDTLSDAVSKTYGSIGQASPGYGKAQPLDAIVMTIDGPKRMGDIVIGDLVATPKGGSAKVIGVFKQGKLDTYRVTLNDGSMMYCNDEHLFTVQNHTDRRSGHYRWRTMTLRQIMDGKLRTANGRVKWFIPITKPVEFKEQTVPIDPYLLGCLIADGKFGPYSVMFSNAEEDILERIDKLIPETCKRVYTGRGTDYRLVKVNHNVGNELKKKITDLGLWDKRSQDKFIPDLYLRNSKEVRLSILQGLFDCDGSVTREGMSLEYSTSSKQLAEDVSFIVQSLGGIVNVSDRIPKYTYKEKNLEGRCSYRVFITMPKGTLPFTSKKHSARFRERTKYGVYRNIVNVEHVGMSEMQCIMVDSPDHLYMTNDFIVTHNTVCSLAVIAKLGKTTAILVHKEFLMTQWAERIMQCYDIDESEIGYIQQDRCDYEGKKIVMIMVQSLLARDYPEEVYKYFGCVCVDEVHRFGAVEFRRAITMFPARYRIGVTATPKRADGLERVFYWHIGKIAAVGDQGRLKPRIEFIRYGNKPSSGQMRKMLDYRKQITMNGVLDWIIKEEDRNDMIVNMLYKASVSGRKILILSNRIAHLENLKELFEVFMKRKGKSISTSFYIGGMKEEERKESARQQVLFGTYQMASEGLDIPDLDTLFLATPKSDIEQSVGRILRTAKGKKEPIVIDIIDSAIGLCNGMVQKRKKQYIRLGYIDK